MSSLKPSLVQGTRDFDPATVRKRNYIFNTIRTVFERYGFQPLETPAMEQLETLMGKYGEEGDKLIFKILNNGLNDPKNIEKSRKAFEKVLEGKNEKDLTERALRYDLTIPFARFVAMNHGQLTFPFKRYQMQPVWRADRPQKGRYREFYQCDADVVGSKSLLNEVELASIYHQAFQQLAIPIEIRINNRKILAALAEVCGGADNNSRERVSGKITHSRETSNDGPSAEPPVASLLTDITVAIDKLDKIGLEKVKEELTGRGLDDNQVAAIEQYLGIAGDNAVKLSQLKTLFAGSETGLKGIAELEYILEYTTGAPSIPVLSQADEASASASLNGAPTPEGRLPLIVDLTLARGLNYYTGTIFEVKATTVQMGSIGGGGRYDDLTGLFGVPNIPGVGISFGVDRIYDVMEELKLFPKDVHTGTKVLFFNLGDAESRAAFGLLQQLRAKGIPAEIYHEQAKFDKQFKYAEKKGIRYVVILGSEELGNRQCKIKDLSNGQQKTLGWEELVRLEF